MTVQKMYHHKMKHDHEVIFYIYDFIIGQMNRVFKTKKK